MINEKTLPEISMFHVGTDCLFAVLDDCNRIVFTTPSIIDAQARHKELTATSKEQKGVDATIYTIAKLKAGFYETE